MKNKLIFLFLIFTTASLFAQGIQEAAPAGEGASAGAVLPLKRVVILTSGLAYYEHSGPVNGAANITIPFRLNAMNDALKTLVINDPSSANPSVTYQSERTLIDTLRSLTVDLSDSPDMATILARLRGEEVEITLVNYVVDGAAERQPPVVHTGRIAGIEYRHTSFLTIDTKVHYLMLNTNERLMTLNLDLISSIKFTDPNIENDINRALDLISASRNSFSRNLMVNLPGTARRNVAISYVIPSPVWKVSYRLDLGASKPLFQGWAIVDNDSDTDWTNVQLSLVAGRPVSFIQELYPPY